MPGGAAEGMVMGRRVERGLDMRKQSHRPGTYGGFETSESCMEGYMKLLHPCLVHIGSGIIFCLMTDFANRFGNKYRAVNSLFAL